MNELRKCLGVPAHMASLPITLDAANSLELRDAEAASWLRRVPSNETVAKLRSFYQPYTCRFCKEVGEQACASLGFVLHARCHNS